MKQKNSPSKKRSNNLSAAQIGIIASVITVIGVIATAFFNYLSTRTQIELPIQATQTAEAKQVQAASNMISITPAMTLQVQVSATRDAFSCSKWSDDFSQISGWADGQLDWGSWVHENGEYRMNIYGAHLLALKCNLCNGLSQEDFRLSIIARTPQPKGSWGVYFWDKDKKRYSLELDENGNALIKRYEDFDYAILDSQPINLLTSNDLAVEYINETLGGYVNGERVLEVSITSPPVIGTYGVGMIQLSLSSDSAEVFFDDFSFSGCP